MRTIELEFNEDQLQDLPSLGQALFDDAKDPRSNSYIRVLRRPKVPWIKILCFILFSASALVGIGFGLAWLRIPLLWDLLILLALAIGWLALWAKRIALCLVRMYQHFAPARVRNKCRFEPSCSEYMILAIQKYGLIKGGLKGRDRLKRCNVDGGGFDWP